MDVSLFVCCVLSDIGLCDEPITRQEESYLEWCILAGVIRNINNEGAEEKDDCQTIKKFFVVKNCHVMVTKEQQDLK
jgi:hypothetical protein